MKPIRYFMWRVIQFEERRGTAAPWIMAVLVTAGLILINLLGVSLAYEYILGIHIDLLDAPRAEFRGRMLGALIAVSAVVYGLWIASGRHTNFAKEFRQETLQQRKRRSVYVVAYMILSVVLPTILAILHAGD